MKVIHIVLIMLLLSNLASSQQSYRIQLDSLKFLSTQPVIDQATDGDVIFGYADVQLKISKLNVAGNIVWNKNYGSNSIGIGYENIQIVASPDTGFYVTSPVKEDMFGWFHTTYFRKVDKMGIPTSFMTTINAPITGEYIKIGPVNQYNNDLYAQGVHTEYDGVLDQQCCGVGYALTVDTNLNLELKTAPTGIYHPIFIYYDSLLNTKLIGQNINVVTAGYYQINCIDTLKNLEWERRFFYDSTQISQLGIKDYQEYNGDKYIVLAGIYNSLFRIFLHKLDANWNTIYFKVLDPYISVVNSIFLLDFNIGVFDNDKVLLAGGRSVAGGANFSILIELDTSGNVIHSWRSSDDYYYNENLVDTLTGSAVFVKRTNDPGTKYIQLERQYPAAPVCNYIPYQLNPLDIALIDSLNVVSVTNILAQYPYTGLLVSNLPTTYSSPLIPICGILNSSNEQKFNDDCADLIVIKELSGEISLNSKCELLKNSFLSLFDSRGRLLFRQSSNRIKFPFKFPISNLNPGVYIINAVHENEIVINHKFVLN